MAPGTLPDNSSMYSPVMCKLCKAFTDATSFAKELVWVSQGTMNFASGVAKSSQYDKVEAYAAFNDYCPKGAGPLPLCKANEVDTKGGVQVCTKGGEAYCKANPASRACPQTKPAACVAGDAACKKKAADSSLGKLGDIFANPNDREKRPTKGAVAADIKNLDADKIKTLLTENPYAKIAKDNAGPMLDKLKGDNGDFDQWGADQLKEATKVLKGLTTADIEKISDAALFGTEDVNGKKTAGALDAFGKVRDFSRAQAKTLCTKFEDQLPGGIANAGKDDLRKAGTILEGLAGADIKKIADGAWEGARDAFKEVCKKKGALDKDQLDAIKDRVKKDIPRSADALPADVEAAGGLLGALDEADLASLPEAVMGTVAPSAIEVMGAAKCAKAFTAKKLAKLTKAARNLVNGKDFLGTKGLPPTFSKDQIKALVGRVGQPLGAFVDFVKKHDAYETAEDMIVAIQAIVDAKLATYKATEGFNCTKVQDSLVTADTADTADTTPATRRLSVHLAVHAVHTTVRRLAGAAGGDFESVVRVETSSNTAANQIATQAGSSTTEVLAGSPTIVSVDATDEVRADISGDGDKDKKADGTPVWIFIVAAVGGVALLVGAIFGVRACVRASSGGGGAAFSSGGHNFDNKV